MKSTLLLLVPLLAATAASKTDTAVDGQAAFARLKTLAGEWETTAESPMGKVRITYAVIAGGTAVTERERSDNMPEMLTVYHMDGKRLILTHYCMAGNQPRMAAESYDAAAGRLQFRFLDGTNLTPASGHMHNAAIRFVDPDHLSADWDFYENGKLKKTETEKLIRIR